MPGYDHASRAKFLGETSSVFFPILFSQYHNKIIENTFAKEGLETSSVLALIYTIPGKYFCWVLFFISHLSLPLKFLDASEASVVGRPSFPVGRGPWLVSPHALSIVSLDCTHILDLHGLIISPLCLWCPVRVLCTSVPLQPDPCSPAKAIAFACNWRNPTLYNT